MGVGRQPKDLEAYHGTNMSQWERDMVASFIGTVAEFLKERFPTQTNTPKKRRQKVQSAEGNNNNNNDIPTTNDNSR